MKFNKKWKILTNAVFYIVTFLSFGNIVLADSEIATDGTITKTLTDVTKIILIIGAAVCVGKCIQIGIMYTMSSANEKSNAKMALIPWVIGAIVCFGAATIGGAVINIIGDDMPDNVLEY